MWDGSRVPKKVPVLGSFEWKGERLPMRMPQHTGLFPKKAHCTWCGFTEAKCSAPLSSWDPAFTPPASRPPTVRACVPCHTYGGRVVRSTGSQRKKELADATWRKTTPEARKAKTGRPKFGGLSIKELARIQREGRLEAAGGQSTEELATLSVFDDAAQLPPVAKRGAWPPREPRADMDEKNDRERKRRAEAKAEAELLPPPPKRRSSREQPTSARPLTSATTQPH